MAPNRDIVIEACRILARERNIEVTIVESAKGALITGFGAFAGGILGGPIGLAVGGVTGGLIGAYRGRKKYKSLVTVIDEMPVDRKNELGAVVQRMLKDITAQDVAMLMFSISTKTGLKEMVLKEILSFLLRKRIRQ